MADTTSKQFGLRFFYFAFACLLYSIWRLVDLLVWLSLFEESSSSPQVTANDVLTVTKRQQTGIG
jgi:IS4 transposase